VSQSLRICLIASARFAVCEPFAGGLEAHTHLLATELIRRGHEVSVFAGPGSDPSLPVTELPVGSFRDTSAGHGPSGTTPEEWMREHHAYLDLMLQLVRHGAERFDVIHNNSLHYLPVAMSKAVAVPMLTTLHTPPVPWLESALVLTPDGSAFAAVSEWTRQAWGHVVSSQLVLNGIDVSRWQPGPGGGGAVWSGRIVPEKAPHEAIDAARLAGLSLQLVGPVHDRAYFAREVAPRLGGPIRYAGHLDQAALSRVVGGASVALVSPAWEEPFGLVAAEAMACGTPVAAYARGALPEIVDSTTGRLARAGDVADLARVAREAMLLDRAAVRTSAEDRLSVTAMTDAYQRIYESMTVQAAVA
jgi:glycosyltransferase involved in cell wall biosynthesis